MIGLMSLIGLMGAMAQGQKRYTVNFQSHGGESFSVFLDGNLVNRMPQSRVMVGDVTDRTHEVVVVLKRPVQKAAVLNLLPSEPSVMVNVVYDERTEELSLYTPSHNRAESRIVTLPPAPAKGELPAIDLKNFGEKETPSEEPPVVTEEDLQAMIGRMKGQSFDSDRLSEAGHSQYLFYGRDWFVWNKGNQFIILPRTEIVGAEMYPGQREGNDLGLLVLEKKNGETLHLAYDIVEGEDPAAQISDWCAEGEDLTSGQIEL